MTVEYVNSDVCDERSASIKKDTAKIPQILAVVMEIKDAQAEQGKAIAVHQAEHDAKDRMKENLWSRAGSTAKILAVIGSAIAGLGGAGAIIWAAVRGG